MVSSSGFVPFFCRFTPPFFTCSWEVLTTARHSRRARPRQRAGGRRGVGVPGLASEGRSGPSKAH